MTPTIYACAAAIAVSGALGFGLYKSVQRNAVLSEQITTIEQERDDARDQAVRLTQAGKQHARELAQARKRSAGESRAVSQLADDGCLNRPLGSDALRVLSPGSEAKPPAPGRTPASPAVRGKDLPRRPAVRD